MYLETGLQYGSSLWAWTMESFFRRYPAIRILNVCVIHYGSEFLIIFFDTQSSLLSIIARLDIVRDFCKISTLVTSEISWGPLRYWLFPLHGLEEFTFIIEYFLDVVGFEHLWQVLGLHWFTCHSTTVRWIISSLRGSILPHEGAPLLFGVVLLPLIALRLNWVPLLLGQHFLHLACGEGSSGS